ncbi:MAG: putative repeat protein (TIGR03806 family) [Marinoscillum sp.]|jgi:uncharacterized repeat protein (TIGR03806 family)
MRNHLFIIGCFLAVIGCSPKKQPMVLEEVTLVGSVDLDFPKQLSEWGFFDLPLNTLLPTKGVVPYELNTPLFSDYALKSRFVKIPKGTQANYHATEVMDFPKGTILIKNFYYVNDLTNKNSDKRIIETRLLLNDEQGWNALTYVWNDEQTEATLEIAGRNVPVSWTDLNGTLRQVNYSVPNLGQCKSCHELSGRMSLIGPTARQLNKAYTYSSGPSNQLDYWSAHGMLTGLPEISARPLLPIWDDPNTGSLAERSRAWLEINCAHCHRPEGPAKNTGLYLTYNESDPYKLGIMKPPVAAGRGSGGLKFGIVPSKPEESILYHRIASTDPGVMMPEVGRKLTHEEGILLIKNWIAAMD